MDELSSHLENNLKNDLDFKENELPIIEDILSKNNLTTGNKNAIIFNENDVILKYAEKMKNGESIYFVKDNKKTYWSNNKEYYDNDLYTVLKAENGQIEKMEIKKNDMPEDIGINDVFKVENGKYIIDNIATKELQDEIKSMAQEIINKQNINLDKHRKEGHLYRVSEELGNNRFLRDLTDGSKTEFEEVNIPKEILEKATEGTVLKFTNGIYEYYSNDGFEMIDER